MATDFPVNRLILWRKAAYSLARYLEAALPLMALGRVLEAMWARIWLARAIAMTAAVATIASAASAQSGEPQQNEISVELNKLEPLEKGCRAYIVVANGSETAYQSFKLDLVLFGSDGIIAKRFALDLAPLKASKRIVKLFDLDGVACDGVGNLLINDVLECRSDTADVPDCLARMKVSSLTKAQLSK